MNVLSVFDGISCGRVALEKAGIKIDLYFASEIDKHAIRVSQSNYPTIIRLGDVREIDINDLPKINLFIGGSPCQSFSFAGKRKGMATKDNIEIYTLEQYLELKKQGFEFEGQSYLFWEYVYILRQLQKVNPNVKFLLENVTMHQKWKDVISEALGIQPILINSNKYSAQNRRRLYWTNIEGVQDKLTDDLGLTLNDILLTEGDFTYPSNLRIKYIERRSEKGRTNGLIEDFNQKAPCLMASMYKNMSQHTLYNRKEGFGEVEGLVSDGDTLYVQEGTKKGYTEITNGECFDYSYPKSATKRGRRMKDKGHCLLASNMNFCRWKDNTIRFLHPIEGERLQGLPIKQNNLILELCYKTAKEFVDVVNQCQELVELVGSVEKTELKECVKNVMLGMNVKNQLIKYTVQENVDTQIQRQIKNVKEKNQTELNTIVNNVNYSVINQNQEVVDSVHSNVFINITEGKITYCGKEEYHQKEQLYITQSNGKNPLRLFGKEIMQFVEDVQKNLNIKKNKNFTFTTLNHLNIKSIEQMLIIYYLFAKNVIDGYIQNKIQIKNLLLNFNIFSGYTQAVSLSQRFKCLGNGWNVPTITHIFNYLK